MYVKARFKLVIIVIILLSTFTISLYSLDKIVTPTALAVADAEMRAKATEIINTCILEEYNKEFNYDSIIKIEKDKDGNIVLLKADTLKLNQIASKVSIKAQKELQELGTIGIKVPSGYITRSNIFSYFGPSITVKALPIGNIETTYSSEFETAGINQTRHKIYVQVKTQVRVIIPLTSNNIEVKNEIPISETIIVGKIPDAAINYDMQRSGYKLTN